MPQTQRPNLLGRATPAVNPRYQEGIDTVAAHDKALADNANPTDKPAEVAPVHDWEKRYKDLQSYNSRKINDLTQQLTSANQTSVAPVSVPKTAEELAAMKSSDPEGYARIEAIAQSMVTSQMGQYDQNLAAITTDLNQTKIDNAELTIRKAHQDFDAIVGSNEFHGWAEAQSPEVQDWIYNNPDKPELAIHAITLFKSQTNWGTQSNTQDTHVPAGDLDTGTRSNSQAPEAVDRNHPSYIWKESEIAKMRPDEFGKWVDVITLAQGEGRVAIGH
jgi:hypothetical protein